MIVDSEGKIYNSAGEIVAFGQVQVDTERGAVTLRTLTESPLVERQHGALRLELEDGTEYTLLDRVIRYRLNVSGAPPGPAYRLFMAGRPTGAAK